MEKSFLNVLKYPDFKKIWLSQVLSQIALNMLTFAMVLHIYEITGSAASISLVMIVSAVPVALVGPFSGILADKIDYRKILIYANLFRFLAGILLIFSAGNILGLLEIIFIISALSQIFTPAESASLPLVVPKESLVSANSVNLTTTYVTLLFGYSIAGPLLGIIGPHWLFFLCALFYLGAAQLISMTSEFDLKDSRKITLENIARGIETVWTEVKLSFKYIKEKSTVLNPMIKLTVGWIVLGAFITLLPAYSENVLDLNPRYVGPLVIAPAGLGMFMAALVLNRKKRSRHNKIINTGFIIASSALIAFSAYHFYETFNFSKFLLFFIVIILGFGSSLIQIPAQTLLHLNSDDEMRGRVFGISSMQLRLATALPALVVGGISDLTSPLITMILLAATVFLYSLILVFED